MSIKMKLVLFSLVAFMLGFGLTLSAQAWNSPNDWCTECSLICHEQHRHCLTKGIKTPAECDASLSACFLFTCGGCIIP